MDKPTQLKIVNPDKLRQLCQEYIDDLEKNGAYVDDDYEHYIFEQAIEMVFGSKAWGWINAQLNREER